MLSRLQLRVRNRRSFRKYPLFIGVDPSAYSNAMLGLVLCLLITFMMDTKPHHGTYIDQYRSRNATPMPAALREDALRIMLTRDGSTYFGNSKVANEDVPDQLRQRIKNGSPAKVYLVADPRAKYRDVSAVLDEVQDAGIWNVAFLAESTVMHR